MFLFHAILGETAVALRLQSQLQLRPTAVTIASCKHRVRGLTQPQVASILHLSSRTLSCLYMSRRPRLIGLCASFTVELCLRCMLSIILLLCVSNLLQVFSKYSFRWHSTYFPSAFYSSFRRKNPHWIFRKLPLDNFPYSTFCKIPLPVGSY